MKRIAQSIFAAAIVCALAWVSGFDFSERSVTSLFVSSLAISAFLMVYIYPRKKD
jgi:uncharacterized membrane protein YfcA